MRERAHAKVNIFLKITGYENNYHTIKSRFMRVEDLYDIISFIPGSYERFTIEGCDDIPRESNTIYKAFEALKKHTNSPMLIDFFYNHKVVIEKNIPSQAGLGGGSSDAATFMRMANIECSLNLDTDILAQLGGEIGADLPFFIYNYPSANVSGFGQIVQPFFEEPLKLEISTPNIGCDTAKVYQTFKKYFFSRIDPVSCFGWEELDSKTLLKVVADPIALNDLYAAAMTAYIELEKLDMQGWFFSGSGDSFFRP